MDGDKLILETRAYAPNCRCTAGSPGPVLTLSLCPTLCCLSQAECSTSICHPLEPSSPGQGLVGAQCGLLQVDDGEGLEQVLQGTDGPR